MSYNKETGMYEGYIYKIYNDVNDKLYIGQTIATIKERWHGHMSSALNEKRYKSALYNAMRKYGRECFHIEELEMIKCQEEQELIDVLNELEKEYIIKYNSLTRYNGYNAEPGGNNKKVPGRSVDKYDIDLNYMDTYISCEEAGRQNRLDGCTIYSCCTHNQKTAGGFVWAFSEEEPITPNYTKRDLNNIKIGEFSKKRWVGHIKRGKIILSEEAKLKLRLYKINENCQIDEYNAYGELIATYKNIIEAAMHFNTKIGEIRKNINGDNLKINRSILRRHGDPFDKYPRSSQLQPISVYNIKGELVQNFECIIDAEKFVGCPRGEILKAIKRGGTYKNFLFSYYGFPLIRKTGKQTKSIIMCDDLWNELAKFNFMSDVNKYFNIKDCHHSMLKAIMNKNKYRDYYWKYEDEFAVNA